VKNSGEWFWFPRRKALERRISSLSSTLFNSNESERKDRERDKGFSRRDDKDRKQWSSFDVELEPPRKKRERAVGVTAPLI